MISKGWQHFVPGVCLGFLAGSAGGLFLLRWATSYEVGEPDF